MRRTADSWFILQLSERHPQAVRLMERIKRGRDELKIPTVILVELQRIFSRRGAVPLMASLLEQFNRLPKVSFVPCDVEIARKAGSFCAAYNVPTVDAIVAATTILTNSHALLSGDGHFKPLRKQNILKIESW